MGPKWDLSETQEQAEAYKNSNIYLFNVIGLARGGTWMMPKLDPGRNPVILSKTTLVWLARSLKLQDSFNEIGYLLICKQSDWGWEPSKL